MIPAPILPRTRDSLWELLDSEPQRVERGFSVIERELVIQDGLSVDALARDSAGRLVLLFLFTEDDDARELPLRVIAAHHWVARNARLLLGALSEKGGSVPARVVVVGFDFPEECVSTLVDSGLDDLAIYRCEAFVLGGRLHAGMSPLRTTAREDAIDDAGVPHGVADAELLRVGEEIVDVLSRLDPGLEVRGDRYSRRFYTSHGLLAELYVVDGRLFVASVGEAEPQPVTASDARRIADSLVRSYLAQADRPAAVEARHEALREALHGAGRPPQGGRLRIDHALRPQPPAHGLGDTEVSQEEFDAFRGLTSEKEP